MFRAEAGAAKTILVVTGVRYFSDGPGIVPGDLGSPPACAFYRVTGASCFGDEGP